MLFFLLLGLDGRLFMRYVLLTSDLVVVVIVFFFESLLLKTDRVLLVISEALILMLGLRVLFLHLLIKNIRLIVYNQFLLLIYYHHLLLLIIIDRGLIYFLINVLPLYLLEEVMCFNLLGSEPVCWSFTK